MPKPLAPPRTGLPTYTMEHERRRSTVDPNKPRTTGEAVRRRNERIQTFSRHKPQPRPGSMTHTMQAVKYDEAKHYRKQTIHPEKRRGSLFRGRAHGTGQEAAKSYLSSSTKRAGMNVMRLVGQALRRRRGR